MLKSLSKTTVPPVDDGKLFKKEFYQKRAIFDGTKNKLIKTNNEVRWLKKIQQST